MLGSCGSSRPDALSSSAGLFDPRTDFNPKGDQFRPAWPLICRRHESHDKDLRILIDVLGLWESLAPRSLESHHNAVPAAGHQSLLRFAKPPP